MPVTELAHLPLSSSSSSSSSPSTGQVLTPTFLSAAREVLKIQDAWCAENLAASSAGNAMTTTTRPPPRGVGLFVQVDNNNDEASSSLSSLSSSSSSSSPPLLLLLTAHWDSVAQHGEWIRSQANRDALALLALHLDMPRVSLFHVDGVEAFRAHEEVVMEQDKDQEEKATLGAPYVSVSRFAVSADKKADFERAWDRVGPIWQGFVRPYVHRGGWRVEKPEEEDKDEFVLIGGWDSLDKKADFAESEGYAEYDQTMKATTLECDTKFYRMVL